eukprot:scaffold62088_cov30-Tisochrysis_lutea.AAC.3
MCARTELPGNDNHTGIRAGQPNCVQSRSAGCTPYPERRKGGGARVTSNESKGVDGGTGPRALPAM